jgi:Tol biopolymer transport system component
VNATAGVKSLPSLSPDGKLLAYTQRSLGYFGVYLEDLATRNTVRLSGNGTGAAFSPDGRRVAFGVEHAVDILNLDDKSVRHLEVAGLGNDVALAWAPDGSEIVIASRRGTSTMAGSDGGLWAIDVASGRLRVVRNMSAQLPAYSPHGLRIAFLSRAGGPVDVWTTPPDGGDAVRLTNDPATDWSPVLVAGRQAPLLRKREKRHTSTLERGNRRSVGSPHREPGARPPNRFSRTLPHDALGRR